MKNIRAIITILSLSMLFTGCSVFKGRPRQNNIEQARGSYLWMNQRLDEEQAAEQLEGQFGNQEGNANDGRAEVIDLDATFPGMTNNSNF